MDIRNMRNLNLIGLFIGIFFSSVLGLSELAANLTTAFPPPPSATLTVPIIILQCPR